MLSLVLPTYNEAKNIEAIIHDVHNVLHDVPHEIIVVDDNSPDKTWQVVQNLAEHRDYLRVIRRVDKRGLSSAVIDGFLAAKGTVLAVMDADGQHQSSLLPRLWHAAQHDADIAIGSRYVEGGNVGEWDERRYGLSRLATALAIRLCKVKVKDPMSGFFAIRRETFEKTLPRLNPKGFKILLDFLVHVPRGAKTIELPMQFGKRMSGDSKMSFTVQLEFLEYLYDVTIGRYLPLLFVKYSIVGSLGVIVHLAAYYVISRVIESDAPPLLGFSIAVIGATETAIVFNFLLNNVWTFKRAKLRGLSMLRGFLTFNVACAFGGLANFAVSRYLFALGWHEFLSVLLGAFVGVIWNYTMNRLITWRA